jgi:hypothetical protein
MLAARTIRTYAKTSRLLVLLALFALGGTACSDLEGLLPIGEPVGTSEEASEDPAAAEEAGDAEGGDDAAAADTPSEDGTAAADDEAAAPVEPITTEDIEDICADEEASAVTAEELAPLVGTTPAAFQELVCSSVAS